MIQCMRFNTGGFVLHKIPHPYGKDWRISAWYDANGNLVDCEMLQYDKARPIARNASRVREYLASRGRVYKHE